MNRRNAVVLAVLAFTLILAGCLLRPQDHPDVIPNPFPTPTATPSRSISRPQLVTVYLVRQDRLAPAQRPGGSGPDRLSAALQALTGPPGPTEGGAGLRSALPAQSSDLVWRSEAGTVHVSLPLPFDELTPREQLIAIAQLVYTITENSQADRVAFSRRNGQVNVPDGAGRLLSRPVTRQDYRQFAPG